MRGDADQPALLVEQTAAAGAGRHGCGGLDHERAGARPQARDQPFAQGALQPLGCADRVYPLADPQAVHVGNPHRGSGQAGHRQQAQVALRIGVGEAGLEATFGSAHSHRRGTIEHVAAGGELAGAGNHRTAESGASSGRVQALDHHHRLARAREYLLRCGGSGAMCGRQQPQGGEIAGTNADGQSATGPAQAMAHHTGSIVRRERNFNCRGGGVTFPKPPGSRTVEG
jgi:hypothetical protein